MAHAPIKPDGVMQTSLLIWGLCRSILTGIEVLGTLREAHLLGNHSLATEDAQEELAALAAGAVR